MSHATEVSELPFSVDLDTRFATNEGFDYCGPAEASVWYSFTPTDDMRLQIDTSASSYWAVPYVFKGTPDALSALLCGRSQTVRLDLSAGETDFIEIASWSSGGGNLALRLSVAPPPLSVTLNLSAFGSVKPTTGIADVAGTISCNQAAYVFGSGTVQQKIGNGIVNVGTSPSAGSAARCLAAGAQAVSARLKRIVRETNLKANRFGVILKSPELLYEYIILG